MSLLSAYTFLPAGFTIDLPGLPPFNKFSVTILTIMAYMVLNGKSFGVKGLTRWPKIIVILFVFSPFITAVTNSESYMGIDGLRLYDGLSIAIGNAFSATAFLLGVKYFRTSDEQLVIFKYIAVAVLLYSFLALYEIRMSPQLHVNLYGFFPHDWRQQYRDGGFRAVIFLGHGLLVALFLAVGLGVWCALKKSKVRVLPVAINNKWIVLLVFITLVFMKSLAALIFGLFLFTVISFFSNKRSHQLSVLLTILFITYPLTSALNLFPHKEIVDFAYSIDPARGQSLEYRFDNEEILLSHAREKPLFGWGGWGRNRVYDPETGEDLSVTDGRWILTLGIRGWVGFLAEYMLIILPIWFAYKVQSRKALESKTDSVLLSAHALIISIILIDQMPNASTNPLYLLLSGALLGRVYNLQENIEKESVKAKRD
jgi:hypothetical protein